MEMNGMLAFIGRRIAISFLILFGSSFLVYNMEAIAGDPLAALAESNAQNKVFLMQRLTAQLQLNVPPPARYFLWLKGIAGVFTGNLDFGKTRSGGSVLELISAAVPVTLRLVTAATFLAIILGISIGVLSAIRQYSRLDYTMTFISFLFFSLPVFWIAVLLKQYLAIGFNDFLVDGKVTTPFLIAIPLIFGVVLGGFIGGGRKRFWISLGSTAAATFLLLELMNLIHWFQKPGLGIVLVVLFSAGVGIAIAGLTMGFENKTGRYAALSVAVLGGVLYYPFNAVPGKWLNLGIMLLLALVTVVVGGLIGRSWAKEDRGALTRIGAITAVVTALFTILDKLMQVWNPYVNSDAIGGRPLPTISAGNDLMTSTNYWWQLLDVLLHLLLPTLGIMLISFAGYVRYARSSLLEVMNMDYIRTARAKGLTERTVVVRHALRNAMIPLTTLIAFDLSGLIGGAFITESIYGWKGMGTVFLSAVGGQDLNLLMGVFFLTSFLALMGNLLADITYSALDPRIRMGK
jgi:peptide/nickel transport system permease protein